MSDKTPNSTDDLNGSEPSMEDILASIRKIISEDEPVALGSPEDAGLVDVVNSEFGGAPNSLVSDAVADTQSAKLAEARVADTGSVDLNIDDVLASLDDDLVSDEGANGAMDTVSAPETDVDASVGENFESDDDILAFLDEEIPLESGANDLMNSDVDAVEDFVLPASDIKTDVGAEAIDFGELETKIITEDSEMDALLDDILLSPEDEGLEFTPDGLEGTTNLHEAADFIEGDFSTSEQDSDLNLVKSLMADLADDPDAPEIGEDLDALLEIPEMDDSKDILAASSGMASELPVETPLKTSSTPAAETFVSNEAVPIIDNLAAADVDEEVDILGDILDMTIEDELESQPDDLEGLINLDDVAAAEQDNILENALEIETPDVATDEALPSLSDIAAAAEADAIAVETNTMTSSIAASAGAAIAGGGLAALGAKTFNLETEPETNIPEIDTSDMKLDAVDTVAVEKPTETSQPHSHQETSMPVKAVKTDTILDEVTETATAGAFAELNSVVEDKAIFNERGPRIGDLVQDALRPMLKEWLDANLKGIVERAVTKEVKRISSGK